jgi:hypothetical protein
MSPERPYFGPAYEYEIDPEFRPSYLNLERGVPSFSAPSGVSLILGHRWVTHCFTARGCQAHDGSLSRMQSGACLRG